MNKVKPIVFVASPYAGDDQSLNIDFARRVSRRIALETGAMPFAPHLLFPQFLNDQIPDERDLGISYCSTMMDVAKFAAFVVPKWRTALSSGMRFERIEANEIALRYEIAFDHNEVEHGRAALSHLNLDQLIAEIARLSPQVP